jgi:hypothetical protein
VAESEGNGGLELPQETPNSSNGSNGADGKHGEGPNGFDPGSVSESVWSQWRGTVARHGLERECLGRLAPSLRVVPTVIWRTPLHVYLDHSLAEIRALRTHGEKRVRVVLEVFYEVNRLLGSVAPPEHLGVRLTAKFIPPLERWIDDAVREPDAVTADVVRENLVTPLLEQIALDAGDMVHSVAVGRLGVHSSPHTIRQQSRRLGVARARVYQLLDECSNVMGVRWPEGRGQLAELAAKLRSEPTRDEEALRLVEGLSALLFPAEPDESAMAG